MWYNLEMITHLSYSQYNQYKTCPRAWYLGKVKQAEEKQAWYTAIGSAVHSMIEEHLRGVPRYDGKSLNAEDFFYPLVSAQMAIEPDTSKWMAGGSKAEPVVEERALRRVEECFEKALTFLDEIDVWEVEYDATGYLPGLEVPVKAFVDITGEHKKHGPVILDWKTGSSKPSDNFQLETYKALLSPLIKWTGLWAMLNPTASKARPIDLSAVDPAEVGAKYQVAYEGMRARLYPTKHSKFKCGFCFHQDNCLLNAGPTDRAKYYDRAHEDGLPY